MRTIKGLSDFMNVNDEKLVLTPLLRKFMRGNEDYCVAGCCGANAFAIKAESIKLWVKAHEAGVCEKVIEDLEKLIQTVAASKAEKIWSEQDEVNEAWTPKVWVEWLQRWVVELKKVQQMTPEELARRPGKEQEPPDVG